MSRASSVVFLLVAAALGAGCKPSDPPAATEPAAPPPGVTSAAPVAPAAPAPSGQTAEEIMKLEAHPGATPALPLVLVPPGKKADSLDGVPGPSPAMGPSTALVKVYVFSDFQCPVCPRAVEPLKSVVKAYPGDVQVIFLQNPLTSHPRAAPAAAASIAALRQGKFWEYHDRLFQNQNQLGDADLVKRAEELGLDTARFQADMQTAATLGQIAYERALAEALGVDGTPGLLVNGRKSVGWSSYYGLRGEVETALSAARALAGQKLAPEEIARVATAKSGEDGKKLARLLWGMN